MPRQARLKDNAKTTETLQNLKKLVGSTCEILTILTEKRVTYNGVGLLGLVGVSGEISQQLLQVPGRNLGAVHRRRLRPTSADHRRRPDGERSSHDRCERGLAPTGGRVLGTIGRPEFGRCLGFGHLCDSQTKTNADGPAREHLVRCQHDRQNNNAIRSVAPPVMHLVNYYQTRGIGGSSNAEGRIENFLYITFIIKNKLEQFFF